MAKPLFLHKEELVLSYVVSYRYFLNSTADSGSRAEGREGAQWQQWPSTLPVGQLPRAIFVWDLQERLSPVPTAPHQAVQAAPVAGVTS